LAELVQRLLAKDPNDRPESAAALLAELDELHLEVAGSGKPVLVERLVAGLRQLWHGAARRARSVWSWCAHGLRPAIARSWTATRTRAPALQILERRITMGGYSFPLGAPLAFGSLLVGLLGVTSLLPSSKEELLNAEQFMEDVVLVEEDSPQDETPSPSQLAESDEERLQDIVALPVYKRNLKDWLELGALYAKAGQWRDSTAAYRNAVQLDKDQRENPELLQAIRTAAEHKRSYEVAINLATTLLGEPGMDLLYDLWMETKHERKKRLIWELAYKKLEILHLTKASKALRVRLELEFADPEECEPLKKTLERAIRHADQRSIEALTNLKRTDGCGASKKRDCYTCLRDTDDIEAALETAREMVPPRFDGSKYVPAP
jgi:hypothetical protein